MVIHKEKEALKITATFLWSLNSIVMEKTTVYQIPSLSHLVKESVTSIPVPATVKQ